MQIIKLRHQTTPIIICCILIFGVGCCTIPFSKKKGNHIEISALVTPPRNEEMIFKLNERNAQRMVGCDDSEHERWCDISGNFYSAEFVKKFSYEKTTSQAPQVWLAIEPDGDTLKGRLEARNLKPNFAYQIKLFGDFKHQESFETIGYAGRWRLPGIGTNYRDKDYEEFYDKKDVEAYLFFDFFTTDENGDAVREFALSNTLHVLWNGSRQRTIAKKEHLVEVIINSSNPYVYARPKKELYKELIWAERERQRYQTNDTITTLPEGSYQAKIVLTEESFHSKDNDGGFWATPLEVNVKFKITHH